MQASSRILQLPEGTALVIPPQPQDYQSRRKPLSNRRRLGRGSSSEEPAKTTVRQTRKRHWVICLFTSWHYDAQHRSPPEVILANTALALEDLKTQLEILARDDRGSPGKQGNQDIETKPAELWACRINAGLFGVEWERTKRVLADVGLEVTVVSP
jgi:ADP-ribose 1''-phosphate phosphatase